MFSRKTIANDRASTDRLPCPVVQRGVRSSMNAIGFRLGSQVAPGDCLVRTCNCNLLDKNRDTSSRKSASILKKANVTKKE